jgi:hypothetical protein
MEKMLTLDQLFETKEKKASWMPSIEEFNNIEPYKSLLIALGDHVGVRVKEQTPASITKGVRYIHLGAKYDCKVSPVSNGNEGQVNFTYGAYKIYSNIPFSSKKEREKAMELFILYSIGKSSGYNINQGIFGEIEKYLTGQRSALVIKDSYADKYCEECLSTVSSANYSYTYFPPGLIKSAYMLNSYLGEKGFTTIINMINIVAKDCKEEGLRDYIINGMLRYASIDTLCDYIKKNPLAIHIIDDMPELKKEVLQRTGIEDYSKIGRLLKHGLI